MKASLFVTVEILPIFNSYLGFFQEFGYYLIVEVFCCHLQICNSDKTKFIFIFVESVRDVSKLFIQLVLTALLRLHLSNFPKGISKATFQNLFEYTGMFFVLFI